MLGSLTLREGRQLTIITEVRSSADLRAKGRWTKALIIQRIPADVADPGAHAKAAVLAQEFVASNPWAREQGDEVDLDHLCRRVVSFVRGRGYDLLDEPPGCHPATPEVWVEWWGPKK